MDLKIICEVFVSFLCTMVMRYLVEHHLDTNDRMAALSLYITRNKIRHPNVCLLLSFLALDLFVI